MSAELLSLRQRTPTVAAVVLIVSLGLAGAGLAVAARTAQSATAQTKARQQLAQSLVPIEQFRADNGSYAGMTLALLSRYVGVWGMTIPVKVAFASPDRYCLETIHPPILSRAGSLAAIVSGPCTRAAIMAAPLAHDSTPPDMPKPYDTSTGAPGHPPRWATDRTGLLWHLAEGTRPLMQGYWLEHGASFEGATSADLRQTYGWLPSLPWHIGIEIVSATQSAYCATLTLQGATLSLHGPRGRVTIGGCS